jgi:hypothetical protein
MAPSWLLQLCALAVLAAGALLATCAPPPPLSQADAPSAEDTAQRLQGTWLREYRTQGTQVRRVLDLHSDGSFEEMLRATDEAGTVTQQVHEGSWLYDGTNLKRKYTLVNGQPPSRLNLPFATFEVHFESRNAFVGVDHIHGNRISYQRVAPQTRP